MTQSYVEYYKNKKRPPVAAYLLMYLEMNEHVGDVHGIESHDLKDRTYYFFPDRFGHLAKKSIHGSLGGRLDNLRDGTFPDPLGRFKFSLVILPPKNGNPEREEWVYYLEPVKEED